MKHLLRTDNVLYPHSFDKRKDEEENCMGTNRRQVVQNISRHVSSVAVAEDERGKWKRRMKQPKQYKAKMRYSER